MLELSGINVKHYCEVFSHDQQRLVRGFVVSEDASKGVSLTKPLCPLKDSVKGRPSTMEGFWRMTTPDSVVDMKRGGCGKGGDVCALVPVLLRPQLEGMAVKLYSERMAAMWSAR